MKFVYLHGFNSYGAVDNPKVEALSKLGEVSFINYDSFASPYDIIATIGKELDKIEEDFVLVGSSLGGFFVNIIADEFRVPSILLNPAYDPYELFKDLVGISFVNFYTKKEDRLDPTIVEQYRNFRLPYSHEIDPLVIIASDDSIVDPDSSYLCFARFSPRVVNSGGHRLENLRDYLPEIVEYLKSINN